MSDGVVMTFLRWIKKRKITVLLFIFSFIVSGLIINLFQLFTLPMYWVSKRWFRHINTRLVYFHWCILPWALESWAEYDIKVFAKEGDLEKYANTEHALCVLNHRGDLDWMIGWVLIERAGMLGGTKAIMKDVAKYLPGIGWTFLFMEYPFLTRNWTKDEKRLKESCDNLLDYPVNMLLCLFAEGTRFTPEKHKISAEFAESRGLPVLKHHLFPRTKGFCFILKNMKTAIPAVYDITICYREGEPTIMGVVNAEPCKADIFIRRLPTTDIPMESEQATSDWLIKVYQDKDELVEYYNQHKKFPEKEVNIGKRPWPDMVVAMWLCLLGIPALFTALYLAWVGKWFILALIVAAVILADQLFQYIANETNTAKTSSSYGLQPVVKKNGIPKSVDETAVTENERSSSKKKQ